MAFETLEHSLGLILRPARSRGLVFVPSDGVVSHLRPPLVTPTCLLETCEQTPRPLQRGPCGGSS